MEKDLDALEQAMSQLHRAMSRHRRWEHIAASAGVNLDRTSSIILQALANPATKHCKLHEVAEKLGIEAPAVTRKTQLLEQAGLLEKQVDKKDGRAFILRLTARGRAVAERLRAAKRATLKTTLAGWSSAERHELAKLIQKFADSVSAENDTQQKKTLVTTK